MTIANMQGLLGGSSIPAWMLTGQNPDTNDGANSNSAGTTTYSTTGSVPFTSIDPRTLQALGWTGGNPVISQGGSGGNQDTGPTPATNTLDPRFLSFLQAKGITPSLTAAAGNGQNLAFYGPNSTGPGNGMIGVNQNADFGNDNTWMGVGSLLLGGAAGVAAGGLGATADTLEAGAYPTSALSDGALAGDEGGNSLGAELGSNALDEGGGTFANLGDDALPNAADVNAAGGGSGFTTGDTAGIVPDAASTGGGLLSTIGNTAASALTSKGIGALVGAGAGLLGNASGLNSATTTQTKTIDPRIAQYIYGADGNSGLLGNVNSVMNQQLATGGLNATQQQGLASQLAVLNNPNYATGFNQERSLGSSLLGNPVAGNPFTGGGASVSTAPSMGGNVPSGAPMPLAGTLAPGQTPAQLQAQRMQIPAVPRGPMTMRNGGAVRMGLL